MTSTFSYSVERICTIGAICMLHCIDMILQYFIIAYLSIADPIAAINMYGVHWLTRVCKGACRTGHAPKQRQTSVIKPVHKKGDKRKCTSYWGIFLISVLGKVYAKCLEKKCCEIVEPKLMDAQRGFCPGRSTMDQIFALQQIF